MIPNNELPVGKVNFGIKFLSDKKEEYHPDGLFINLIGVNPQFNLSKTYEIGPFTDYAIASSAISDIGLISDMNDQESSIHLNNICGWNHCLKFNYYTITAYKDGHFRLVDKLIVSSDNNPVSIQLQDF